MREIQLDGGNAALHETALVGGEVNVGENVAYGLDGEERDVLLDVVAHLNQIHEIHRRNGGELRLPGWKEMWDAGSGDEILRRSAWFEANREDLRRSLA